MKTLKIAVTALVIAGGVFSAFAFTANNINKSNASTTYYPIADNPSSPNSYHWETSVPAGFECVAGNAVCSVTTDTPPTDNQLPSGVPSTNKVYRQIEE